MPTPVGQLGQREGGPGGAIVGAAVETVTMTLLALDPFKAMLAGTEHVTVAGAPAQASVTVWLSPPPDASQLRRIGRTVVPREFRRESGRSGVVRDQNSGSALPVSRNE